MPVHQQYVPLYGPIGQCRQHALAPNPYLVYLGGRFCGDERTYLQYPVALASSRTDERHVRDDDPLLSKNRSMAHQPSIFVGRQCNMGATTLGHRCRAPKQPAEMVNNKMPANNKRTSECYRCGSHIIKSYDAWIRKYDEGENYLLIMAVTLYLCMISVLS